MKCLKFTRLGMEVLLTFKKQTVSNASCSGCPPELETVNLPQFLGIIWGRITSLFFQYQWDITKEILLFRGAFWFYHHDSMPMNYALLRIKFLGVMAGWKRPSDFWYKEGEKRLHWKIETIRLFRVWGWNFQDVGTNYCSFRPPELGPEQ